MRKDQWIELVQKRAGVDFQLRTIALHIENAINTVLGQLFARDPQQWDMFSKSYTADVVPGTRPYALLPESIIQTPDLAKGVRRIYANGSDDLVFVPIPASGHQLFHEVGLDQIDDSVGYEVKADRVRFFNMRYPITSVTMDLVIPFSKWSDSDDFPIPSSTANIITDMAVATVMGKEYEPNIYKKK